MTKTGRPASRRVRSAGAAGRPTSPALVALTALLLYTAWVGWAHHIGHDWRDWAAIGEHFVGASEASPAIARDAEHATSRFGYDGQFFLYIARDPDGAVPYLDIRATGTAGLSTRSRHADWRWTSRRDSACPDRPQPARRRGRHLGGRGLAASRALPEWFALLYAAFPGVFFGVWRDLSEPLAIR